MAAVQSYDPHVLEQMSCLPVQEPIARRARARRRRVTREQVAIFGQRFCPTYLYPVHVVTRQECRQARNIARHLDDAGLNVAGMPEPFILLVLSSFPGYCFVGTRKRLDAQLEGALYRAGQLIPVPLSAPDRKTLLALCPLLNAVSA